MTTTEAFTTSPRGGPGCRAAATVGLVAAMLLLRLAPFRVVVAAARLARRVGRRTPDPVHAADLVDAVRHTGRWWPTRVACLETSLAATLAAAVTGRRPVWCLGARFRPEPVEYHAWVCLPDGTPVGEYLLAGRHHHATLEI
ncbi:hypothetical protein GCM10022243_10160 [Saccharothrix violaceirubra]|uniref:Microcin J25-processing protein McjB C-terminal domain-containing protein n=1 Tax=Saccharothrix violaceirubra TaxID=413306 RepID=A0A7W7T3Z5_9PSEU|nr:lasso peptide biosynthesis B2 protein [Saccharothrix violaceirubra]MBB4966145.1 hypothetical protein [Saccharothrix violaceirubra]